jgi:hypothetical protein
MNCTDDCTTDCGTCKGLKRGDAAWWMRSALAVGQDDMPAREAVMVRDRQTYRGRASLFVENIFTEQRAWVVAAHCKPRNLETRTVECAPGCHSPFYTSSEVICITCGRTLPSC